MYTLFVEGFGFLVNLLGAELSANVTALTQLLIYGYHDIYQFFY
jgi:hypothetical protein